MKFVPALGYHRIVPSGKSSDKFELTADIFQAHLKLLKANNFKSIDYDDFIKENCSIDLLTKGIMITFDDGYSSDYHIVLPLLQQSNFKATFFITVNLIGRSGYLTGEQIIGLSKSGMSIQSHSFNHVFLPTLGCQEILYELRKSKDVLEGLINKEVNYIALPGGRISKSVIKAASDAGYKGIFTSKPGFEVKLLNNLLIFNRFIVHNNLTTKDYFKVLRKDSLFNLRANCVYAIKNIGKKLLYK